MGGRSLRLFPVALMLLLLTSATAAAELDKSAVEFTPPSEIVHYDGAKDEETIIQVWGMGPATSTPAEKR